VFASGQVYTEVDKPADQITAKSWEIYKAFLHAGDKVRTKLTSDYMFTNTTLKEVTEDLPIGPEN
jgi:hypothetical protein